MLATPESSTHVADDGGGARAKRSTPRRGIHLLLAIGLVVSTHTTTLVSQASGAEATPSSPRARVLESSELSPRLRELVIESPALGGPTRARVLLPASYDTTTQRYPVLYLLHGANNDYTRWTTGVETEEATAPHDLIVVMPDGGPTGFYSDWYNDGAFGPPAWETYHLGELRALLEQEFRANGRYAVAGHSMGGFGALSYAARHPDLFDAVLASSPASDTRYQEPITPAVVLALTGSQGESPDAIWGGFDEDEIRWRAHNPLDLAPNLARTPLVLTIGNGLPGHLDDPTDPTLAPMLLLEGALHAMNRNFLDRLVALGIEPPNDLGRPGSHIIDYAFAALQDWLPDAMAILEAPKSDHSESFSYRSAENEFSVWGWRFVTEGASGGFTDVTIENDAISANGSGRLRVTTAPIYDAGRKYRVSRGDGSHTDAVADTDGRVTFELGLTGTSAESYSLAPDLPGPRHGRPPATATIAAAVMPSSDPSAAAASPPAGDDPADRSPTLPATGRPVSGTLAALLVAAALAVRFANAGARPVEQGHRS